MVGRVQTRHRIQTPVATRRRARVVRRAPRSRHVSIHPRPPKKETASDSESEAEHVSSLRGGSAVGVVVLVVVPARSLFGVAGGVARTICTRQRRWRDGSCGSGVSLPGVGHGPTVKWTQVGGGGGAGVVGADTGDDEALLLLGLVNEVEEVVCRGRWVWCCGLRGNSVMLWRRERAAGGGRLSWWCCCCCWVVRGGSGSRDEVLEDGNRIVPLLGLMVPSGLLVGNGKNAVSEEEARDPRLEFTLDAIYASISAKCSSWPGWITGSASSRVMSSSSSCVVACSSSEIVYSAVLVSSSASEWGCSYLWPDCRVVVVSSSISSPLAVEASAAESSPSSSSPSASIHPVHVHRTINTAYPNGRQARLRPRHSSGTSSCTTNRMMNRFRSDCVVFPRNEVMGNDCRILPNVLRRITIVCVSPGAWVGESVVCGGGDDDVSCAVLVLVLLWLCLLLLLVVVGAWASTSTALERSRTCVTSSRNHSTYSGLPSSSSMPCPHA
ncbi:hypothetical protein DFJ77DRAFT_448117 [Powellomyces hirtus]|nr:hypothetical protein DFJ77DRAFT_448117 [Powellomyces hirtus]